MNAPVESANVARHLRAAALATPDHPAVIAPDGGVTTFSALDRESDACAAWLESLGVRPGMRVLLMVKPGADLILCVFALFKLGAPPVAIDPGMGLKNFLRCVATTRPDALVGIPTAHVVARVFSKNFASIRARARVGDRAFRRSIRNFMTHVPPGGAPVRATPPDEPAAILFTSGSTGAPKGVLYEHGMFEAQLGLVRAAYGAEPGAVDLPMLPIFALFNPALGATTVVPAMNPGRPGSFDPAALAAQIRLNGVTTSFGSPVLWKKLARHLAAKRETLPTLRRVLCAGAPVSPSLHEELKKHLPGATIHTPYGATECLPVCTITGDEVLLETRRETESGGGVCVGRPVGDTLVAIMPIRDGVVARTADNPPFATPGEIGEIIVRSRACTRAYDRNPEADALSKIRDDDGGFFHRMGDVGRMDECGRLWFLGRKVERVTTASGTLFTEPAEGVFNTHPRVFRSALIGLGAFGAQTPALVVQPEPGEFPYGEKARAKFVSELLEIGARHAATAPVKTIFFRRNMPVDVRHNAKIHRLALAREYSRPARFFSFRSAGF